MLQQVVNVGEVRGIPIYRTRWMRKGSGICLPGVGIFVHQAVRGDSLQQLIQHEYGHYLDYAFGFRGDRKKFLGSHRLGFYLKIGLPSVLNLLPGFSLLPAFKGDHRRFWTEIRANVLASEFFGKSLARDYHRQFPMD